MHKNYGYSEVSSKGMELKEVNEFVSHLQTDHGLGHFKREDEFIGGKTKFVNLHFKIKIALDSK